MRFFGFTALLGTVLTFHSVAASPVSKRDSGLVTVFTPPFYYVNEKTLYARSLLLDDSAGTILTTWENYEWSGEPKPYFPIYRSTDHGHTWSELSRVHDTVNNWGLRYQPLLYQLPEDIGTYAKGTIILAGNSIPYDLSKTKIDIYASTDSGSTWSFVSSVASGGRAIPNNGETPVWEPFLMVYKNQLVCYYSDQRDPAYGQKLVHQVTFDLKNWEDAVDDVAEPEYSARPGMPIISKLANGKYFYTYENGGAPEGNFAVYYKISDDPLAFGHAEGQVLRTTDNYVPTSSPYNVWTPVGGASGTIVVNAGSSGDFFLNKANGTGSWTRLSTPEPAGYTRSLAVAINPKDILIVNGGALGMGGTNNVSACSVDISG